MGGKFVQHTTPSVVFEDLSLAELIATMITLAEQDTESEVEFTVIAHGKVKPGE